MTDSSLLPASLARPVALCALVLGLAACATAPPVEAPVAVAAAASAPEPAASAASAPDDAASAAATEALQAAEAAVAAGTPTDPVRPDEPVNLADEQARRDLWQRIRAGFAIPDLDTELVRSRERWYAGQPDYMQRMTERSSRYLFHIVEEVEKRGLPTELALLPFIESAFNPQAKSRAKASGMWQFMPATGRHFELKQNVFRDDRRDVLASTRAALDYLEKLHRMFGDWHLALAAYNWGEGSVSRAMARNRKAGRPTDYLSLKMPAETRHYVPKLQAIENLVADPQAFGLELEPIENHPYFLSVPIQRDIDAELVAQLAGLPLKEFHALNPSLNQPVILAAGTPQVLLPYDNANTFVRMLPEHRGPLASWTAWVVPKTMKPADAAKQVAMSEAALREVNRIPPRMLVRAGSTLLVPRNRSHVHDVSLRIADNATMQLAPESPALRRTTVRARQNESVAALAKRVGLPAANVARWNDVGSGARFAAGQRVVLYLPVKAQAKATRSAKSAPAKRKSTAKAGSRTKAAAAAKPRVASPSR